MHDWQVDIDDNGTITSPGKFEGQPRYMPTMYALWLEGFGDEDQAVDCITIVVSDEDKEAFPELAHRKYVKFTVTDQGFVQEVGHGEQY